MFSLNDSMRYLLYNHPTDMRKSFHTLSGIITDAMGQDPCSGNVYIFINRARDRIKLLHWEPGGMVLYSKLLEAGTLGKPDSVNVEKSEYAVTSNELKNQFDIPIQLFLSCIGYQ